MKKAKKPEFSKIVLVIMLTVNIALIVFACVMMWRINDLTPLAYIVPSVAAEVSAGTAGYYWKAKTENKIKLAKAYGIEISGEAIMNNF